MSKRPNESFINERLGMVMKNNFGLNMEIIEYKNSNKIKVIFDDGTIVGCTFRNFLIGDVRNPNDNSKTRKIGEKSVNERNEPMIIVDYKNQYNVFVKFIDNKNDMIIKTTYSKFKNGKVLNPYSPTVMGVGIVGVKYPGNGTREYEMWSGMLKRCFSDVIKTKRHTYEDCTVCEEWLNYENFVEWLVLQENYEKWKADDNRWAIDKDILIKRNKKYSPKTCCLVPERVNSLFTKADKSRGEYYIGVSFHKASGKYQAQCEYNNKNVYLGVYTTPEEAFQKYKEYKESIIKEVAIEEFDKNNITLSCYESMMSYVVEQDD